MVIGSGRFGSESPATPRNLRFETQPRLGLPMVYVHGRIAVELPFNKSFCLEDIKVTRDRSVPDNCSRSTYSTTSSWEIRRESSCENLATSTPKEKSSRQEN